MTQETIAILAIGLPCLGGLIHIVWKLSAISSNVAVAMAMIAEHDIEITRLRNNYHYLANAIHKRKLSQDEGD